MSDHDLPEAPVTAAAVDAVSGRLAELLGEPERQWHRDIAWNLLAAALPALTEQTAADFRQRTEDYQHAMIGVVARERADAAAQGEADEREACAQLAEQHHAQYASCPVKCDNPACGKRAGFAHLIRARDLLGGTADGAHPPGGTT